MEDDKIHPPTQKKLRDSREKGKTFSSKELSKCVVLSCFCLWLWVIAKSFIPQFVVLLSQFISHRPINIQNGLIDIFMLCAPHLSLFFIFNILSIALQRYPVASLNNINPDPKRIMPSLKKIISMQVLFNLIKTVILLVVVILLTVNVIKNHLHEILYNHNYKIIWSIIFYIFIYSSILACFIGIVDYMYQRHQFLKGIRMSHKEIQDEFKETEGNPEMRSKLKNIRRRKAKAIMMEAVKSATVVIRNPEHYAVALKYDYDSPQPPRVVAKGVDAIALKIIEVAQYHNVKIKTDRPLASNLYYSIEIDDYISEKFFVVVAEVIKFANQNL